MNIKASMHMLVHYIHVISNKTKFFLSYSLSVSLSVADYTTNIYLGKFRPQNDNTDLMC